MLAPADWESAPKVTTTNREKDMGVRLFECSHDDRVIYAIACAGCDEVRADPSYIHLIIFDNSFVSL